MIGNQPFTVRPLEHCDVHAVLGVIGDCRREYGLENRVQAILEPSDHRLFDIYRRRRSAYFVALVKDDIVGGAGIARLPDSDGSTCELQRMYLRPASRGLGIGHALLTHCLEAATQFEYQRCYAETISEMATAIAFYERHGFHHLNAPIGQTGHNHNDCWMLLDLHVQGVSVGV